MAGHGDGEERLVGGYSGRILWLLAVGSMAAVLGQFVFPLLLPTIIEELAISPARAGFVITVIWLLTAAFRYPGGRLADQLSRKTVIVGALALVVLGLLVFAASVGYWTLVAGAVVLGAGLGMYFPAALAQISDLFSDRRGTAMGIHIGSVNIGGAVASGLVIAVLAVAPWRATFLPLAAVIVLVLALTHAWNVQPYVIDRGRVDLDLPGTAARMLRTPGIPWVVALLALFNVTWQGFLNFLPTFLQFEKGLSPSLSSAAFAAFFVAGAVANPAAGRIGDRFRGPYVAAASSVVSSLGLAWLVVADSPAAIVAAVLVLGVGGTALWPVMTAYVMDVLPSGSMGGDFGALSTIYILVGSAGPTYVGFAAERFSYTLAYTSLIGFLLASVAIALWLSYRY